MLKSKFTTGLVALFIVMLLLVAWGSPVLVSAQTSPTPAPTATPLPPTPTPVPPTPTPTASENNRSGTGGTTILILLGIIVIGFILAITVPLLRIRRK